MAKRMGIGMLFLVLSQGLAACDRQPVSPSPTPRPAGPESPAPTSSALAVFTESVGFSTSDVRDAQEQIVQFTRAGELIWTADDTRLPGYLASGLFIPAEKICKCALEVRFGTKDGERRAYLTAEYGHYNPGTLIDLELLSGVLTMTHSTLYPPGTYTLSGVVTELTPAGQLPIEGIWVSRLVGDGWREAQTDDKGFYKILGLYDSTSTLSVGGQGYRTEVTNLTIHGDTRFDIQLVRQ